MALDSWLHSPGGMLIPYLLKYHSYEHWGTEMASLDGYISKPMDQTGKFLATHRPKLVACFCKQSFI